MTCSKCGRGIGGGRDRVWYVHSGVCESCRLSAGALYQIDWSAELAGAAVALAVIIGVVLWITLAR